MRKTLAILLTFAMAGFLAACAAKDTKPAPSAEQASYEAAVAEAKAAQKKAAGVGGEWRDIGKFMKQADAAAKAGDYAKAMKLVKKAKSQAELGYTQAMAEKGAKEPSYIR